MAKQTINIGTSANKGDGDPLRTAFNKINLNFTELYDSVTGQTTTTTYVGPGLTSTVFTVASSDIITGKFILQMIGTDQTVQGCEVIAIKALDNSDAYAVTYGVIYTSVSPVATVDAIVDIDNKIAITVTSLGLGLSVSAQSTQQITRWEN